MCGAMSSSTFVFSLCGALEQQYTFFKIGILK
jgi:hypothetical protein